MLNKGVIKFKTVLTVGLSVLAFTFGFEFAQGLGWDTANHSRGVFAPKDLVAYFIGFALALAASTATLCLSK